MENNKNRKNWVKEYWQKKNKQDKTSFIIKAVIVALAIAFLLVGVFANALFGKNSVMGEMMGENVGEIANIFKAIGNRGPSILKALTLVIVISLVSWLIRFILKIAFTHTNRGKTIINLLNSFIKYAAGLIIVFSVLSAFGVDTATLLASAGILALMISLGAQGLVADIIAGLSITFEGEFKIGDIVVIDGFRGTILEIGIRTTKLVDASGNELIVNNAAIGKVINMSSELSLAVIEVSVEYGDSIERIEKIIKDNLETMRERIPAIQIGPFYKGVSALAESGVNIKIVAQCDENDRYQVERDMNREIKIIFDKNNVNIPFPQVVVNKPIKFEEVTDATRKEANEFVDEQKEASKDIDDDDVR
jgi:small conductance mechanosensitive channel